MREICLISFNHLNYAYEQLLVPRAGGGGGGDWAGGIQSPKEIDPKRFLDGIKGSRFAESIERNSN